MLRAFGRSTLPMFGRATLERWLVPIPDPDRIPAAPIPPALGGRGTERPQVPRSLFADVGPRSAMRTLLFAEPIPRSGVFIGRWTLLLPIGRCTPRLFIEV